MLGPIDTINKSATLSLIASWFSYASIAAFTSKAETTFAGNALKYKFKSTLLLKQ